MGEVVRFPNGANRLPFAKPERIEKKGHEWKKLVQQLYEKDGRICRACGRRSNLTPHHMVHRSRQRLDVIEELLTLCSWCNDLEKDRLLEVKWVNRELRIIAVRWRKTTAADWEDAEPGRPPAWFHGGAHPLPQIVSRQKKPDYKRGGVSFREHLATKGQSFSLLAAWDLQAPFILKKIKAGETILAEEAALMMRVIDRLRGRDGKSEIRG